ncbi:MAG TPA: CBS domain-containing protein [Acidimicrobiales bacterium]|jgi:CBS domain-containing protein|nr:CBS domain-containing protein [Acidimicrobiales bacterium]
MRVEAILRAKGHAVETIRPDAKVQMAVHRMRMQNVGALVVCRDGERVEGVLSERDLVRGLARHGADLLEMSVVAIMSRNVPTCGPDDSLAFVMDQMTRTRQRHLPVLEAGTLSGIVSIGDVVKHRLEEMELETHVLRDAYLTHR